MNTLYNKENVVFDKNEEIKNYILKSKIYKKMINLASKINALSIKDSFELLNLLSKNADNEEKKEYYNKLYSIIYKLGILKEINEPNKIIKSKIDLYKSKIIVKAKSDVTKKELEEMSQNIGNSLFDQSPEVIRRNNTFYKIVKTLNNVNSDIQASVINNLKKRATDDDKLLRIKMLEYYLDKNTKLSNFSKKVAEKHLSKSVFKKIEKEKKYGIYIQKNNKLGSSIIMRKPTELNKNKLMQIKKKIIKDFTDISEKENDSSNIVNKYLIEKENEEIIEQMANVITTLDKNDKSSVLEEIKKHFDNPKYNNLYNKFEKILTKKETQFDNEKRKKQSETIKEIEEEKKKKTLSFSFGVKKDDNNIISDILNIEKDI